MKILIADVVAFAIGVAMTALLFIAAHVHV